MKHLLLTLLLVSFSSALADTPEKITEDYRKASEAALVKVNGMMEKAATPLIAQLVAAGDTAGAALLTAQLKSKLAGEAVPVPHASATLLFAQYDQARAKALEPVQKAAIARIESMLKGGASTPNLETVTELGKVREMIDGGIVVSIPPSLPMVWDYFTGSDRRKKQAELIFKTDGTCSLVSSDGARNNKGKWSFTTDPNVLNVTLFDASPTTEQCEFRITGSDAELIRPVGTRYLRVTPK